MLSKIIIIVHIHVTRYREFTYPITEETTKKKSPPKCTFFEPKYSKNNNFIVIFH